VTINPHDPVIFVNPNDQSWAVGIMADILIENGHEPTTSGNCDSCSHGSNTPVKWPCALVRLTPQSVHQEIEKTVQE
jgi:hypothetical protein